MINFRNMEFDERELAGILCKFDLEHLERIGSLLYFAGFSGDTKEVVECLNQARIHLRYNGGYVEKKLHLFDILESLNEKELKLIHNLADEAEMCASCDKDWESYRKHFSGISIISDGLLEAKQIKKNK